MSKADTDYDGTMGRKTCFSRRRLPPIREHNQRVFEDLGISVAGTAQNGSEALEKYGQLRPDLVSMDIIMPEMHGIDCYNRLLAEDPNILILFVSCLAAPHIIGETILEVIPRELFVHKPATQEGIVVALEVLYGVREPKVPPAPETDSAADDGDTPDPPTTRSQTLLNPPDEAS